MIDPLKLIQPGRPITGISAILLPFASSGAVDWGGFENHVRHTLQSGLSPAINMDTGYANLIDDETRLQALKRTQALANGQSYVAGVFVGDQPGQKFDQAAYCRGIEQIQEHGGTPIFFQSFGLCELPDDALIAAYGKLAGHCDEFLFFELGTMFAPFGRIYDLEIYEQLLTIPNASGAKHSSLNREMEWARLELRNRVRPEFKVFTGNDLAIDMVMYGSDYLLGLSTFAPSAFAVRDRMWESGDTRFYALNDLLQYLGTFAFRSPTSAYKHSAAMFLNLRGRIATDLTHPKAPKRPESDREILQLIVDDLERFEAECE